MSFPNYNIDTIATFELKKQGYDPLIDYLKGLCIVFVIMNHCMPIDTTKYSAFFFWGVSAVPIFLMLQVFHAYKKGLDNLHINWKRLWTKILWPFLLCELVILAATVIESSQYQLSGIVREAVALVKSGGYGPGAYYPWVYLQFAILLPLIAPVFKRSPIVLCIAFIIVSQAIESACSYFGFPQLPYRLSFFRYTFLFYLGFLLAHKGFTLNLFTLSTACICLAVSAWLNYSGNDLSPFLYTFVNPLCHWFCYIYIAWLLLFILQYLYDITSSKSVITSFFITAGKYSYEIFLFQIVWFVVANNYLFQFLEERVSGNVFLAVTKTFLPVLLCTFPVIIYKRFTNEHQQSNSKH